MNIITPVYAVPDRDSAKDALETLKAWAATASDAEIEALDPSVAQLLPGNAAYPLFSRTYPDDFAVGETVHGTAGMLPRAGGEEVAIPRKGHFGFRVVVPIAATATARVVGDFADGDGGVAIVAKVSGEAGRD